MFTTLQVIGADTASCSCIQPMVAVIRMALVKHPDSRGVQTMISELLASLEKRFQFGVGEKQLMVATLLDPRFKDRFMSPDVRQRVYGWLADEALAAMARQEEKNGIPVKRIAVEASQLPQSAVWDAFDQVIQGSQTATADAPQTQTSSMDAVVRQLCG